MEFDGASKAKRPRIFLVDDEAEIGLTFKVGLEKQGFVVDVFCDPNVAISKFRSGIYDLLLLDIKMPKLNGFELYKEIEKIDGEVKVCFMTAFVTYYESLREVFPSAKVTCFIKKPIEIGVLADRLRKELQG